MIPLPDTLLAPLTSALSNLGDTTPIRSAKRLGGGCINNAMQIQTGKNRYFMKWNENPLPGMFTSEAAGLRLLASTKTVKVPIVLASAEASSDQPAYILLEWLEGSADVDQARLGEQLSELHRHSNLENGEPAYGLDHNNYLGSSPQMNEFRNDWPAFFVEKRLVPQMKRAVDQSRMPADRQRRLERLMNKIPEILKGASGKPSLIHGDLWSGNLQPCRSGLALIDPAVSYSDREAEIAYTELFGGFSSRFYSGYQTAWPLSPGYPDRRDLYNLYHLINHLNIFGESYGSQVDFVLRRYS